MVETIDMVHTARRRQQSPAAERTKRVSDIVCEFLGIMRSTPILPLPLRPFQHLLVRAAIDLTPPWLWAILGLNEQGPACFGGRGRPADRSICGSPRSGIRPSRSGLPAHAASS